jgi:transcriptional regulator with XRE-family HTH domain
MLKPKDLTRAMDQVAGLLGQRLLAERRRRGWSLKEVGQRAGLSKSMAQWIEAGNAAPIRSYARLAMALGLRLEFDLVNPRRRPAPARAEDPVHAAMGELLAARLSARGFVVALDEPFQHYQFAGRADLLAWSIEARALLHVENRTRFPNIQDAFSSYNVKRRYLPGILADRLGIERFQTIAHVIAALWSSEVLHVVRLHAASFRAVCPDPATGFETWWSGDTPASSGHERTTSCLIVLDPVDRPRRLPFVGLDAALTARPRYGGYAEAAAALRG